MARNCCKLTPDQRKILEGQGCVAENWDDVSVSPSTDISRIRNVRFAGEVTIGPLSGEGEIFSALLRDCSLGADVRICNIHGEISGYDIGDKVSIGNVGHIIGHRGASCGRGTEVSVLDETGSRSVKIYPGISAQLATLRAFFPRRTDDMWSVFDDEPVCEIPSIGAGCVIQDTLRIENVNIGAGIRIEGAQCLENGTVINNAPKGHCCTYIGYGVRARNFIFADAVISDGVDVSNCYVGQGSVLEKKFSAVNSLVFCNCTLENGESDAVIAGPYTVSMHKSSLLIGALYSFMNAGSGTNFSNHMYKLGPVHWGIAERGVKTSSGAYMMWGGRIGSFSLLMGNHKTHPDTSWLPFSYLFADSDGATTVVPGRMLVSSGLMRDEKKWPMRDRRLEHRLPLLDNVTFDTLNPVTIGKMMSAVERLESMLLEKADTYNIGGVNIRASSARKGVELYMLAIKKYFREKTNGNPPDEFEGRPGEWIDLCGQVLPESIAMRAVESETPAEALEILSEAFEDYHEAEMGWIAWKFRGEWLRRMDGCIEGAEKFDALRDADRAESLRTLNRENSSQTL